MRILFAGEDQKCAMFGAMEYASGQVIFQVSTRKGDDASMALMKLLAQTFLPDEPRIVMLDNVGYHKSRALWEQWRR